MSHEIRSLVSEIGGGDSQQMVNYYAALMDIAAECPGFVERARTYLQGIMPPPLSLSAAATSSTTPPASPKPSPTRHPPTPNRPPSSKNRRTRSRRKNL